MENREILNRMMDEYGSSLLRMCALYLKDAALVQDTFPDHTVLTEVMRLPVKYREVILLRYYQGMKRKEVADALQLSDGRVRSRLNRANAILRDRLKEWYEDED